MEETPNDFTLMEPVSPETLIPDHTLLPWIIGILVLVIVSLLIITAIVLLVRNRTTNPTSIRLQAFKEASTALNNLNTSTAREAAVECSLILRGFLSKAARDRALFETHEEFITRQDSLKSLTATAKEAAATGFTQLAALKYSSDTPSESAEDIINSSKVLLETLNRGFAS